MKNWLQQLSGKAEFLIILLIGFGWFIYVSNLNFIHLVSGRISTERYLTSYSQYMTVALEALLLGIILLILKVRGYKISDFPLSFSFRVISAGLLLFAINYGINATLGVVLRKAGVLDSVVRLHHHFRADLLSVLLIMIFNSFYEEFLLNGYIFKKMENYRPDTIVIFSIIIRVSYHTYQGYFGMLQVMLTGIIFSSYYARYKKLWPLVVAHGLINGSTFLILYYRGT